jgi:hypothetical protein
MMKKGTFEDGEDGEGGRGNTPLEGDESDENLDKELDFLNEEDEKMENAPEETTKTLKEAQKQMKEQFLGIKEKKLVMTRKTEIFHQNLTSGEKRSIYLKLFLGFSVNKENNKTTTYLTPWLIIGRKEVSQNLPLLIKMNITHILNVTADVNNAFPKHFLYEKIPIRDSEEEDIAKYFTKMIAFVKRCEMCEGRVRAIILIFFF